MNGVPKHHFSALRDLIMIKIKELAATHLLARFFVCAAMARFGWGAQVIFIISSNQR